MAITNPDLKYASEKYSLYKLQELESQMINAYSSGLSQPNVVLSLTIISTIILFYCHDNTLHATPMVAYLLVHMKMARVSLEIKDNVTDYSDASLIQDTANKIITLGQHGPTQSIIDTLHLGINKAATLTSTYPSFLFNKCYNISNLSKLCIEQKIVKLHTRLSW